MARVVVGTSCWQFLQILRGIDEEEEEEEEEELEEEEREREGGFTLIDSDADAVVGADALDDNNDDDDEEEEDCERERDLLSTIVPFGITAEREEVKTCADTDEEEISLWTRGTTSAEIVYASGGAGSEGSDEYASIDA